MAFLTFNIFSIIGLSFLTFTLPLILLLSLSFQPKILHFLLVWGVIHVRVFLKKQYTIRLKMRLQGIYISRIVEGINKDDLFSFKERSIRTNKFLPRLT